MKTLMRLLAALLVFGGPVAHAQSEDPLAQPAADEASRQPVTGSDGAAAETPPQPASGPTGTPSEELRAGHEDESIYVVQRRAYSKSGALELNLSFFTSLNNKFVGHLGAGLSAAYHVRENFAVEVTTSVPLLFWSFYSGLVYEVHNLNLAPEMVDLKQMSYFGAVSLQYSALYGKLNFWDKLIDYDFYVTAGTGVVKTLETCVPSRNQAGDPDCSEEPIEGLGVGLKTPADTADAWKIAGNLGGGMRVFVSDRVGMRIEVRDIVYADRASEPGLVTSDIRNNVILFLGASFLL